MSLRRTQAARSQATRDHIVQAALTVFALKSYGASSMDDICLAAGCSKGGLYHHFRTKSAVLSGVIDRLAASDALFPAAADGAAPASAPMPAHGRILLDVWAEAARDDSLGTQLRAAYSAARSTNGARDGGLDGLLRIGALIQLLTRGEGIDASRVAARLGIARAA